MLLGKEEQSKKIVIYGAGIIARAAIIALNVEYENSIIIEACVVSNKSNNVGSVEGVPVFSFSEYRDNIRDQLVVVAVRDMFRPDVIRTIVDGGIDAYKVLGMSECIDALERKWVSTSGSHGALFREHLNRSELSDEEYLMFLSKQLKEDTLIFEVNFANHCNLNCQCCNHFSPLSDISFIDKEQYRRDLRRLNELFGERIGRVMLLGGEPLLNQDICELLRMTRENLSSASLFLFTNGTLLPKMTEEFWNVCREYGIGIQVTRYPIDFNYDYWFEYAQAVGVEMSDENPEPIKTTYRLPFKKSGGLDAYRNYIKCFHANQCIVLRDSRLYTCPMAAWSDILNNHFGTEFPEPEGCSVDIYKVEDPDVIMRFLRHPVKMCEYCDIYNYEYNIPWAISKKEAGEWLEG